MAPNLDIAAAGQTEFFSVDAPAGTSGTMQVTAQSLGLSLLAPKMTVYAADEATVLGSANGAGQYGTTLTVTVPNVTEGQRFYVEVQGADTSAFGTGNYALGLSFKGSTPPAEASPIIAYANGQTLHSGGGSAQEQADPYGGLTGGPPNILGISPDTGTSNSDGITNANRISILGVAANNETITVYNNGIAIGTTVADADGHWTFDNTGTALADGTYTFSATATDSDGNVSALSLPFGVTIDTSTPAPPTIGGIVGGIATGSNSATTADSTPVFFGTARPYSQVSLYQGLTCLGNVAADGNGHWSFADSTSSLQANGSYAFTALDTDVAGNTSSQSAAYSVNVVTPPSSAPAVNVSSAGLSTSSLLNSLVTGSLASYAILDEETGNNMLRITNATINGNVGVGNTANVYDVGPATINGKIDFSAANTGHFSNQQCHHGKGEIQRCRRDVGPQLRQLAQHRARRRDRDVHRHQRDHDDQCQRRHPRCER